MDDPTQLRELDRKKQRVIKWDSEDTRGPQVRRGESNGQRGESPGRGSRGNALQHPLRHAGFGGPGPSGNRGCDGGSSQARPVRAPGPRKSGRATYRFSPTRKRLPKLSRRGSSNSIRKRTPDQKKGRSLMSFVNVGPEKSALPTLGPRGYAVRALVPLKERKRGRKL
jgi:hypothetical protein